LDSSTIAVGPTTIAVEPMLHQAGRTITEPTRDIHDERPIAEAVPR
jgi:hypothetical protein